MLRWQHEADLRLDLAMIVLADLDARELEAFIVMMDDGPQIAPGLVAGIEHVCDWEQNRHDGQDLPLKPPAAAIEPA